MAAPQVTKDFLVRQIETLSQDGLAEVAQFIEFLQYRQQSVAKGSASGARVAFGIWADYPEANDPAAFAANLRENMEKRRGG